jgi:long-chain acyl-CoA synthetase
MFLSQSLRYGDRALYRFAREGIWEQMTWREARARAAEIALGLLSLGVGKGDRVAVFAANRVEWCLIDWANICIGALTVPVYASSTMPQLSHILEHSGATVLVVDSADRLKKAGSLGSVRRIVSFENAGASQYAVPSISLAELRRIGGEYGKNHEDLFERNAAALGPEDDLTIIYTSGTTGEPKGVLTTHRHYLFMLEAVSQAIPWSDRDVDLLFLPLAHSLGRLEHFLVVAEGFTCGLVRSLETIGKDMLEIRPTVLVSVPRIYENAYARVCSRAEAGSRLSRSIFRWAVSVGARWCLRRTEGKRIGIFLRAARGLAHRLVFSQIHAAFGGRLRLAISGGAPLAPEIAKFFHSVGILILEGYGLTESATVSHANRPERLKFGTVGMPLPGVECRIGADGEILLRGPNILKGYYRDPESTRAVLDEAGWFGTGDIGEIDRDGFLRITDRKKDIIVTSGGKNIAPQMVENLLQTDPLIAQAIVLGDKEAHLVALVTLDRGQVLDWARREGLELESAEEMAAHPRVTALVKERIRQKNKQLSAFEAVRNFRIVPHNFTIERAELTPTLKLRRQVIKERYKDLIEEMARRPRFDAGD